MAEGPRLDSAAAKGYSIAPVRQGLRVLPAQTNGSEVEVFHGYGDDRLAVSPLIDCSAVTIRSIRARGVKA